MMYQRLVRPLFFNFDPEKVHHFALSVMANRLLVKFLSLGANVKTSPDLKRYLFGLHFPNPIGLAAGFDKDAHALPHWEQFGFGHVEIGTITRHAQPGNPTPRIFRIPTHKALINRMGFPNEGAEAVARRLETFKKQGRWPTIPVGINIGKSKITPLEEAPQDYLESFQQLRSYADYIAVNVSSPNTPGLRSLQTRDAMISILKPLREANKKGRPVPILVKIAPDLSTTEVDSVLEAVVDQGCAGVIVSNTTLDKTTVPLKEEGGLSGRPLREKSTAMIRHVHRQTQGKFPIIGVGGIESASDAKAKLDAGASLLQCYTGFIYAGPRLARQICSGLS